MPLPPLLNPRRRALALAALVPAMLAQSRLAAAPVRRFGLWGYYPWWLREHWRARDLSLYDTLEFFHVEVAEEGRVLERHGWPQQWEALQVNVRDRGGRLDLAVTLFDAGRFERLFTSAERRARLLAELLALARTADGLHLDFEIFTSVPAAALAGLRGFCVALKAELQRAGPRKTLTAFGVMGAATDLYDRATLELFDHVVMQGYDSHHAGSRQAGPVAPLRGPYAITWESTLAHYLALGAARHKLVFGVPFFGYEWPTASDAVGAAALARGSELTYALTDALRLPNIHINVRQRVAAHGARRDAASGSPYYAFRDAQGGWRQGWFEDERSLAEKFAFARNEGLAGLAIFPIGYDDGEFDALLRRTIRGK